MKSIRNFSKITIVLVAVFMVIALFRYQEYDDTPLVPEQLEYYFDEGWLMYSSYSAEKVAVTLPYSGKIQASETIIFENTLSEEYADLTLKFSAENAAVRVLLDGEVLYPQEPQEDTGEGQYYVYIPDITEDDAAERQLCIELTVLEQEREILLGGVMAEINSTFVVGLVGSNLTDIVCCLLIVITAMIMFVLAMIRWYTSQPSRGELYLGLFGLTAGVYSFIGTYTLNLFFDMREAYVIQEYLMLMLPLFLALYFEQNLRSLYPRRFAALLCVVSCNAVIQILLEWLGGWKLVQMADISTAVVGLACVTGIISLLQMKNKSSRYQMALSVLSVFMLLAGEVGKVLLNAFSMYSYATVAGLHGMTSSGMMFTVLHILQISKEYRFDAEEKIRAAELQNKLLEKANKDADLARHEALAANEAKGKFLAQMSHEIRTPINAVLGMDEMILRESKEQNVREYAMDIYTAGQSLLSLINDILDFSKIDSGKMEIVPVEYDISSLIHDLVNMTSQRAADKGLSLEVEADAQIPSRLYGDDVRIRQILINILTNAVKYTHEGTVWLRVHSRVMNETALLYFEVEDTGIGIKAEDLPKLSAEFERIEEDKNRNIEGTGLGMSITIQLLALLGSRLHVESTYGKGSKFYFELEQKIIDDTPIGDFASNVQQMAQDFHYEAALYAPDAKLLVVDDNVVNRKVLRNLLKETAIQVTEAASGAECLQLVQENQFDLIFLDHMMPEMDGVETLHCMKALPEYPCKDTPVVVLTANAVSGAKEAYLSEGFDDFLSKPIVPDKLEAMLLKMLPEALLCTVREPVKKPEAQEAAALPLEELPFVEGLDWNYAWLHLPEYELLAYTVREFYDQIDSAADCLERAYRQCTEEKNPEPYRIQVHAMKSLAATIGIISLSGIARVLESAAKDGRIEVILSMTAIFLEEWRSYRLKLQGVFGIGSTQGKEVTDYSVIRALVEMVRVSMQEMEIDKADECVRQLRDYDFPAEIWQEIQKLAEAVTNLDPEETERLANLLSEKMAG
ncbi:MAG: response regulator [Lachnospiraceae bacterium]